MDDNPGKQEDSNTSDSILPPAIKKEGGPQSRLSVDTSCPVFTPSQYELGAFSALGADELHTPTSPSLTPGAFSNDTNQLLNANELKYFYDFLDGLMVGNSPSSPSHPISGTDCWMSPDGIPQPPSLSGYFGSQSSFQKDAAGFPTAPSSAIASASRQAISSHPPALHIHIPPVPVMSSSLSAHSSPVVQFALSPQAASAPLFPSSSIPPYPPSHPSSFHTTPRSTPNPSSAPSPQIPTGLVGGLPTTATLPTYDLSHLSSSSAPSIGASTTRSSILQNRVQNAGPSSQDIVSLSESMPDNPSTNHHPFTAVHQQSHFNRQAASLLSNAQSHNTLGRRRSISQHTLQTNEALVNFPDTHLPASLRTGHHPISTSTMIDPSTLALLTSSHMKLPPGSKKERVSVTDYTHIMSKKRKADPTQDEALSNLNLTQSQGSVLLSSLPMSCSSSSSSSTSSPASTSNKRTKRATPLSSSDPVKIEGMFVRDYSFLGTILKKEKGVVDRDKRQNHILSEQKRRNVIKVGFQKLHDAIPDFGANPRHDANNLNGLAGIGRQQRPAGIPPSEVEMTNELPPNRAHPTTSKFVISGTTGSSFSKSDILFKAADYIRRLQRDVALMTSKLQELSDPSATF